jgi:cytochrome c oxidase subunit 1
MTTSFGFFMVGGVLALVMRTELARPGLQNSRRSSTTRFDLHHPEVAAEQATQRVGGSADVTLPPVGEQE